MITISIVISNVGNLYIADTSNHRVRKVTASTGIITTFVGTGTNSYSGDNGAASSATLNTPCGIASDSSGISLLYHLSHVNLTSPSSSR